MDALQQIGRIALQPFRGWEPTFKKTLLTTIALVAIGSLVSALPGVGTFSFKRIASNSLALLAAGYYSFPILQEIDRFTSQLNPGEEIYYQSSNIFILSSISTPARRSRNVGCTAVQLSTLRKRALESQGPYTNSKK